MSEAWEGYREHVRGRRWAAAGIVWLVIAVTLLALQQCLPQGSALHRNAVAPPGPGDDPATVALVVYNENDPLSRDLADFYATKRGIQPDRVVGVKCSIN